LAWWPPRWLRNVFANFRILDNKLDQLLSDVHDLKSQLGEIMATIDDVAEANAQKVTALEAKVDETIVTLQELKALIGTPSTANAEAVLAQANTQLDDLLTRLGAAEAAADPTPDA
jgi:regulator of replication initiation timing